MGCQRLHAAIDRLGWRANYSKGISGAGSLNSKGVLGFGGAKKQNQKTATDLLQGKGLLLSGASSDKRRKSAEPGQNGIAGPSP